MLSPYGKNVDRELSKVYGFGSTDALVEFVIEHIRQYYPLNNISIISIHVAFGMAVKISVENECYYLKFASRSMHRSPEQLFPWLEYARNHDIPLPEVLRIW